MNANLEPELVFDQVGETRRVLHQEYFELLRFEAGL